MSPGEAFVVGGVLGGGAASYLTAQVLFWLVEKPRQLRPRRPVARRVEVDQLERPHGGMQLHDVQGDLRRQARVRS